ncbi:phosphoribosylglycinamide formyltransferase [Viridibacterium curvum]|uniref:Phosphoribosylglycinamide formyltransferase n=1 Tax=Viridibacterium curvum TaxID=1101404 RepID=A0ABP9QC84_9RHOO
MQKNLVILISGRGSNMEAIVRAAIPGARVAAVIANRPDSAGLAFAESHGIPTAVVDHKLFADRSSFDKALAETIDGFSPDLVVLAGFMRVLTGEFVDHYAGRLINIHPSLLPSFPGLHTHQRALEAGVRVHGATVHYVTADLDCGPIIIQAVVPVSDTDDEKSLSARVLRLEHQIYPQAVRWIVEGRTRIDAGRVKVEGVRTAEEGWTLPPLDEGAGS